MSTKIVPFASGPKLNLSRALEGMGIWRSKEGEHWVGPAQRKSLTPLTFIKISEGDFTLSSVLSIGTPLFGFLQPCVKIWAS